MSEFETLGEYLKVFKAACTQSPEHGAAALLDIAFTIASRREQISVPDAAQKAANFAYFLTPSKKGEPPKKYKDVSPEDFPEGQAEAVELALLNCRAAHAFCTSKHMAMHVN